MVDTQSLKSQIDIVSLFQNYGFSPIAKGNNHFTNCPFHSDKTASLSLSNGLYHCFGCGAKGDVISFVQEMDKVDFRGAVDKLKTLGNDASFAESASSNVQSTNTSVNLNNGKTPLFKDSSRVVDSNKVQLLNDVFKNFVNAFTESNSAQEYLREVRGIEWNDKGIFSSLVGFCKKDFASKLDEKTRASLKEVGLLTQQGRALFGECLVFPLRNVEGEIVSLYARRIEESATNNHIFLPGTREGVLGFYQSSNEPLILVESVLDALALKSRGFVNVLALHGVNGWTSTHLEWIEAHSVSEVVLMMDSDEAGQKAAIKLQEKLESESIEVVNCTLPVGEDPCSFLQSKETAVEWIEEEIVMLKELFSSRQQLTGGLEELLLKGKDLTFSLRGLTLSGMDKLKLTVKAMLNDNPSHFVIDHVDFYKRAMVDRFKESLVSDLGLSARQVESELKTLISLLEAKRLELRDQEQQGLDSQGESARPVLSETEKAAALYSLQDANLIENLLADFEACGTVGEEKGKLLGFLGTISRFLDKPLGVLIISRSGAGKTTLQESFCSFVPEEDLNQYSRISEKVLFYKGENGLRHKVLAFEEEEGMEDATYSIRTLQSSQKLSSTATRSDPKTGRMVAEEYTVNGPVFIVISTTNPDALDYETRNRFIILTIDESKDQTNRIMNAVKESYTMEGMQLQSRKQQVFEKYRNMQRLLKPLKVVNPYAPVLEYPFDKLQMRREFRKYMTLINSIALFHQYQRETKVNEVLGEYIEVTPADIAIANELVLEFFPNSTDELAPHTRSLGMKLSELVKAKGGEVTFTRKELRDFCSWSDWQVREGLRQLEELEYVSRVSGRNGSRIIYESLVDVTLDSREKILLTDPSQLEVLLKEKMKAEQVQSL